MDFLNLYDLGNVHELMWEAVRYKKSDSSIILVRVYVGGSAGTQVSNFERGFHTAASLLMPMLGAKHLKLEKLNIKEVCAKKMTISDLIDWLLASDIHFILSHLHQGFYRHNVFVDMNDMMKQLLRLRFHHGYPSGEKLYCPVFTQDKKRYLEALGGYANNTLYIPLDRQSFCDILGEFKAPIER